MVVVTGWLVLFLSVLLINLKLNQKVNKDNVYKGFSFSGLVF